MICMLFIMIEGEEILPTRYFNMIVRQRKNERQRKNDLHAIYYD